MYNIHIAQAEVPVGKKSILEKKIMFKTNSNWPAIAYNIQTRP